MSFIGHSFHTFFSEPTGTINLGQRVYLDYTEMSDADKYPNLRHHGRYKCFQIAYKRVGDAAAKLGAPLPQWSPNDDFCRLWGSMASRHHRWLKLPKIFRGKGGAGAMAWARRGELVEQDDIWNRKLLPGAIVQVWKRRGDFELVRDGENDIAGHSFIFLKYVGSDGMEIADQAYQSVYSDGSKRVLHMREWSYWAAANLLR